MPERNVHIVVFHSPGPEWQTGVDFREQQGVGAHVGHYAQLGEEGKVLMGGPYLELDRGGMMVCTAGVSREEAEAFADADPAIKSGLLTFEVLPWYVPIQPGPA